MAVLGVEFMQPMQTLIHSSKITFNFSMFCFEVGLGQIAPNSRWDLTMAWNIIKRVVGSALHHTRQIAFKIFIDFFFYHMFNLHFPAWVLVKMKTKVFHYVSVWDYLIINYNVWSSIDSFSFCEPHDKERSWFSR